MTQNKSPRGLRNHNPLNIRRSSARWQGMAVAQTDKCFVQFVSDVYGYRAAFINLRSYINKHKCNTIEKIIRRWAPESENDTEAYIRRVAADSGISRSAPLSFCQKENMVRIAAAMAKVENGTEDICLETIYQGYQMLF